jgi:hypothetical protein
MAWTAKRKLLPGVAHLMADMVNKPAHYTRHPSGIEAITITEHFGFCLGNVIKYCWRAEYKNGLEDLRKAEYYIKREIAKREAAQ